MTLKKGVWSINNYELRYNSYWGIWNVDSVIVGHITYFYNLKNALEFCKK